MALVQYVHVLAFFTMKSTELHITAAKPNQGRFADK